MTDILLAGEHLDYEALLSTLAEASPERLLWRSDVRALRACGVDHCDELLSRLEERSKTDHFDLFTIEPGRSVSGVKLLALDMDSTLIENECIDDMAAIAGCGELMSQLTREAMEGKWPFTENLTRRVKLLSGAPASIAQEAAKGIRFSPGAETLIGFMRSHGVQTWIVSGGFSQITRCAAERLGMTGVICNELVAQNGSLTGEVRGPAGGKILDADGKRRALEVLTMAAGAELGQTIAGGDGANDVEMIAAAGMGVAYRAKPAAQKAARIRIRSSGLATIACFFEEFWSEAEVLSPIEN